MTDVAQQFNSLLYGTLNKYDRHRLNDSNSRGRIFLCDRFVYLCMGRSGMKTLDCLGIKFDMLLMKRGRVTRIVYNNYLPGYYSKAVAYVPYPDIIYRKGFSQNLTILSDVGYRCETLMEVKIRVRSWVLESVVPLYLESLFTL
jgi:hypothetical protein